MTSEFKYELVVAVDSLNPTTNDNNNPIRDGNKLFSRAQFSNFGHLVVENTICFCLTEFPPKKCELLIKLMNFWKYHFFK